MLVNRRSPEEFLTGRLFLPLCGRKVSSRLHVETMHNRRQVEGASGYASSHTREEAQQAKEKEAIYAEASYSDCPE
jgi:hypothetical protein